MKRNSYLSEKLDNLERSIDDLENEIGHFKDLYSIYNNLNYKLNNCQCCGSYTTDDSDSGNVTWCEKCGNINVLDLDDMFVRTINPREDKIEIYEFLPEETVEDIKRVWNNEAILGE